MTGTEEASAGAPYERHVLVCTNDEACVHDGPALGVLREFKGRVKAAGLARRVRVNASGCLNQCGHGPMVVVYPEGVWYGHVGVPEADRIWREHVVGGRPVEALRYRPVGPGSNKLPRLSGAEGGSTVDRAGVGDAACPGCPGGP